ncbi:hypothetical protein R1sor_000383 [Riccia sorocarpa]|uniref:Uncharacterized protein n=1 Tax=Riccia sorocarpa TaxID=122646 RepID=A0ABD3GX48_9MARC
MGSESKRQRTVDRKRTDQLGQSSRPIAQANEDRLRLRRQRYVEEKAERIAASNSQDVSSGSQRGIRRKVLEMVDKLKSLSCESVEYESKILTRFLKHSSISKAPKCGTRKFESALCRVYEVADRVNSDIIEWERYEYVGQDLKDEHGREKRRLELVFVETPVSEFIQFMKDKLAHFVKHDFTQKWQAKQYR